MNDFAKTKLNNTYNDNILFHINFHIDNKNMFNDIPQNITYEVVYNSSMLE